MALLMSLDEIKTGCAVLPSGCWRWLGRLHKGYPVIGRGGRKQVKVCHLAYALWHGPMPLGLLHLHRCNNTWCANPEHLYAGTQKDNARDRKEAGREKIPFQLGFKHTPETRAKMSATRRGKPHGPPSQETRDKISATKRARRTKPERS